MSIPINVQTIGNMHNEKLIEHFFVILEGIRVIACIA